MSTFTAIPTALLTTINQLATLLSNRRDKRTKKYVTDVYEQLTSVHNDYIAGFREVLRKLEEEGVSIDQDLVPFLVQHEKLTRSSRLALWNTIRSMTEKEGDSSPFGDFYYAIDQYLSGGHAWAYRQQYFSSLENNIKGLNPEVVERLPRARSIKIRNNSRRVVTAYATLELDNLNQHFDLVSKAYCKLSV